MFNLLSDASFYTPIETNPLKKLQDNTHKVLKGFNDNNFLKHKFHNNQLTLTNTVLAKYNGLHRIHKIIYHSVLSSR